MTTAPNIPHLANPLALVKSMGKHHRRLVDDLRTRAVDPRVEPSLREAWTDDKSQGRTGESFETYRDAFCDQAAASWILCTIFARTLEDRGFLPHRLAGPGAIERQSLFRSAFKFLGERDYLLHIFDGISLLPGADEVFGRQNAPFWRLGPTNRALAELLDELRAEENGHLTFTFGPPSATPEANADHHLAEAGASTRYLGDLYQDLNEDVRKRYALLQTPDFVERFLLDNTLDPALHERGCAVTVLDPACGSGHLLLGAYDRLFAKIRHDQPALPKHEAAKLALSQVYGIDLNPYAAAVARFRLLLSYLDKAEILRLQETPENIPLQIYVGDSLLAGQPEEQQVFNDLEGVEEDFGGTSAFSFFDPKTDALLRDTKFDVIVANPPYITEKDAVKREKIRKRYKNSATGKYALSAPFAERIFQLGNAGAYTGQITANSFMKREFGKGLVEKVFKDWDLGHVVDTSGALIPGHGTPTVILFGRSQRPISKTVPVVMSIRGEPSTPEDPANGKVWLSITEHYLEVGFANEFISVAEVEREKLAKHPWSIGGGGAAELKDLLEERGTKCLNECVDSIGFGSFSGEDDVFLGPRGSMSRLRIEKNHIRALVRGEDIRDWTVDATEEVFAPYDLQSHTPVDPAGSSSSEHIWRFRTLLSRTKGFGGKTKTSDGTQWWEWYRWIPERYLPPFPITYAYIATHNHFAKGAERQVFRGGASAPIINLPADAGEEDYLALLGYLNTSIACFWMKQACTKKGEGGGARVAGGFSIMGTEEWKNNFEFGGNTLGLMPVLCAAQTISWAKALIIQCNLAKEAMPQVALGNLLSQETTGSRLRQSIELMHEIHQRCRYNACALQEELDWVVYAASGFQVPPSDATPDNAEELIPACRPVEILVAEQLKQGEATEWFERFGRRAHTLEEACARYPARAALIRKRMQCISEQKELQLLERLEYKRRWEPFNWDAAVKQACETFLLTRAEAFFQAREPRPVPIRAIADELQRDNKVRAVAEVLTGSANFDLETLLADLFLHDAVPSATSQVYTDEGIENRRQWENVWNLQRAEDARTPDDPEIKIDPPPKYDQKDFDNAATLWRLRGKLDVPKERFIAYPTATPPPGASGKPGLVFGWAGWDPLQKLQATIELWQEEIGLHGFELIPRATREQIFEADPMDERLMRDFAARSKLLPLLQTMVDLLPWVKQWHDEDGQTASAFEAYISDEARKMDTTLDEAHSYRRPAKGSVPKTRRAGTAGKAVVDGMTPAAEKKPRKARAKKEG